MTAPHLRGSPESIEGELFGRGVGHRLDPDGASVPPMSVGTGSLVGCDL